MTQSGGKQPKNKPPEIKTRQPQKRTGGFFDNLRQPHPIEEILGLQQEEPVRQLTTPAATPVATPVFTPADTTASTAVATAVASPVEAPVISPVSTVDELQSVDAEQLAENTIQGFTPVAAAVPSPAATPVIGYQRTTQAGTAAPAPVATPAATPVID